MAVQLLVGAMLEDVQGQSTERTFTMSVRVQPLGNTLKGRVLERQPVVAVLNADGSPDVTNTSPVTASLGENPTGSILRKLDHAMILSWYINNFLIFVLNVDRRGKYSG